MGSTAIRDDKVYTYADYLSWPEDEHWEIIDGVAYAQAQPSTDHQRILGNLYLEFGNYLRGKPCEAFVAPFGVTFKDVKDDQNTTVVEPDLTVICEKTKITKRGCSGAPDLIIEILSPSTASHDVIRKRKLYETNGVVEYWIVDPSNQIVTRLYLNEELSEYSKPDYYSKERMNIITPIIFPELQIDLNNIFPELIEE